MFKDMMIIYLANYISINLFIEEKKVYDLMKLGEINDKQTAYMYYNTKYLA